MERRLLTLHLTLEQTKEVQPYLNESEVGKGTVFMLVSHSYEPSMGKATVKLCGAYLERNDAIKIINAIRKLFGKRPLPFKKKKTEQIQASK